MAHFNQSFARYIFHYLNPSPALQKIGLVSTLSLFLAACGGSSSSSSSEIVEPPPPVVPVDPKVVTDDRAARFLQQASFSSTPQEIESVKTKGYAAWLDEQIAMPIETTGYNWLMVEYLNYYKNDEAKDKAFRETSGTFAVSMMWQQLISQPDVLRKRVALALSEILVVSLMGIFVPYTSISVAAYWDILNKHAFGNYQNLLKDISLSSAMGDFLDIINSTKGDPKTGRMPDENYARELLQLFTVGVVQLNLDGTPIMVNGRAVETYTNADITELAKVFTGLRIDYDKPVSPDVHLKPLANKNTASHDMSSKTFLGQTIPAGQDAAKDVENAIAIIFNHPNIAPFVCKQLIQRLVTSNPSAGYIMRVAQVFNNNGNNVKGDMAAVIKAILLDSEARETVITTTTGKLREPMISLVQWARTFTNKTSVSTHWQISTTDDQRGALAQSPFRATSVFNFFAPNYTPSDNSFTTNNMVAPEFQLVNEVSVTGYHNYWYYVANRGINSNVTSTPELIPDYSEYVALIKDPLALVKKLNTVFAAGALTGKKIAVIANAIKGIPETSKDFEKNRMGLAIWLIVISPDYRVQK